MWLLTVDSSGKEASVALVRDSRLFALRSLPSGEQHSVQLFRSLKQVLRELGLTLSDVDLFAVANGPGAFTALRVGLTVVKGLAETLGKPVVAVSVLEAVCEAAAAEGLLIPLMDAYRGQVFGGLYEKTNTALLRRGPERVLTMEEFLGSLEGQGVRPPECTFVSPQLSRWAERLVNNPFAASRRESISPVLAEAVARRAQRKFEQGDIVDALHLEANYVRRSDAELLWKK